MNKVMIFLGIIFLVILLVIGFLYFYYEKPQQSKVKIETATLNIFANDIDTKEQIATTIRIFQDGILYKESYTLKDGGVEMNVPVNHTYTVFNVNLKNNDTTQYYYTTFAKKELYGSNFQPQRIILNLEEPGNVTITQEGDFGYNNVVNLRLKSNSRFKKIHFCMKWSINIITVSTNYEFVNEQKPSRFNLYDKCYDTRSSLFTDADEIVIPLEYKQISTLNNRDYIDVIIFDEDCFNNNCYVEDSNGNDIAAADLLYRVQFAES